MYENSFFEYNRLRDGEVPMTTVIRNPSHHHSPAKQIPTRSGKESLETRLDRMLDKHIGKRVLDRDVTKDEIDAMWDSRSSTRIRFCRDRFGVKSLNP
jgi:hypothetical protein